MYAPSSGEEIHAIFRYRITEPLKFLRLREEHRNAVMCLVAGNSMDAAGFNALDSDGVAMLEPKRSPNETNDLSCGFEISQIKLSLTKV